MASDAYGAPKSTAEIVNDAVLLGKGALALRETFEGYTDADFRGAFPSELHDASRDTIGDARITLNLSLTEIGVRNTAIAMNAGALRGAEELGKFAIKQSIPGRFGRVFRAIAFGSSFSHTAGPTRAATFTCSAFGGCTGAIEVRR